MDNKAERAKKGLHRKTGEILASLGLISQEQVQAALQEQRQTGEKIGQIMVNRAMLSEQRLRETLDFSLGIPRFKLINMSIDAEAVKLLAPPVIRLNKILPVSHTKDSITLAMADPMNHQVINDVRMATGLEVIAVLADEKELDMTIRHFMSFRLDPDMEKILGEIGQSEKKIRTGEKESAAISVDDDAPIIRIVNFLLIQAVQAGCSDVHLEAQELEVRVRFRVDGELHEVLSLPLMSLPALVSRIKIMAGMDISEKRIPQDGRFRIMIEGRDIDFRVSTLPAYNGEKAALRVLDRAQALTQIDRLGLSSWNQARFLSLTRRSFGMVVVAGSTGSGKTTTLYSILSKINSAGKNIITLEDPIEYSLHGINQVQVNNKAGLTFAGGLGSILRQDPDIIMVGEIRDHETARLAIQAALTGHLVLSTLHTNSAVGTVARLADMEIEKFLLATSLAGVISQRLVRQLCEHCFQQYILDRDTAVGMGIGEQAGREFYQPVGCNMCRQQGYQGRIALQEIMLMGPQVRAAINRGATADELQTAALAEGMISIQSDGLDKAGRGLTSLEEVMKAVYLEG
jgi:type IV pilus assembly protein PilB